MGATCRRIRQHLGANGLLYRYREDDGLPPGEGAFGICAFWEVENLVLQGRPRDAARQFENLLSFANDLGLYAEEFDPVSH